VLKLRVFPAKGKKLKRYEKEIVQGSGCSLAETKNGGGKRLDRGKVGYGWPVEGHLWNPEVKKWGYGGLSTDLDGWKARYSRSMDLLSQVRELGISAAVYTQTTDFENEVNGLQTYDRVPKVDAAWLKSLNEKVIRGRLASMPEAGVPPLNPEP
jgi:hypothetical protein